MSTPSPPSDEAPTERAATLLDDDGTWQRFAPAAGRVRAISGGIAGFCLSIPAAFAAARPLHGFAGRAAAAAVIIPLIVAAGAWLGRARWRRSRWKLDGQGLHVRRGWLWRSEVLIPRSRVQHLDLERGPIERYFGLATLVVHTAATDTSALRQAGFIESDAIALRDALIPATTHDGDAL